MSRSIDVPFHRDAAHGWYEVELAELIRLGIAGRISRHSYYKDGRVYLEEDRDATIFHYEAEARGLTVTDRMLPWTMQSEIRHYEQFEPERYT